MTEVQAATETAPAAMVTEEMIDGRDWRGQAPVYRVSEVANFYFAMSESWLRLKMRADKDHPDTWFVKNGHRMDFRRKDPDNSGSERVFTLADIEPMVYSLFRFGAIDGQRVGQILRIVEAVAHLYGLLTPSGEDSPE
jgi:hypothetical protein